MTTQTNPWDQLTLEPKYIKENQAKSGDNPWSQFEAEESWGKWLLRSAMQVPEGIAQAFTWPADIVLAGDMQAALDPEEIYRLRGIAESLGKDPDEFEERYVKGIQEAAETYPTQHNIERIIEEETGLPTQAKTRGQKFIKFASAAGKLSPKGYGVRGTNVSLPKPVLGTAVAGAKEALTEAGIPEPISDIAAFGILKKPPEGAPSLQLGAKTKPSGLTERRFESAKGMTEISPERHAKVNSAIESDFRGILDDLIETSPIGETTKELAENPKYKQSITDKFEKVQELSEEMPGTFSTNDLKKDLAYKIKQKTGNEITPSEYEKYYNKFMKDFVKETPNKDLGANALVNQFRTNNRSLGEIYEVGQSKAYNRAKKDALLDYNRLIADTIEKKYPKTEFSQLFKESNAHWTKIKDAEFIEGFVDELFEGKVNFKKGEKVFDKNKAEPFRRALGKENFANLETLMEDLMSMKEPYGRLKIAKDKGFERLVKTGGAYLFHPKAAAAKFGLDSMKSIYHMLLDKPKFGVTWKEGIEAFKKKDFAKAEAKFSILDKEVKQAVKEEGPIIEGKVEKIQEPKQLGQKPLELAYAEGKSKPGTIEEIKHVEKKAKSQETIKADKTALKPKSLDERKEIAVKNKKEQIQSRIDNANRAMNEAEKIIKENPANTLAKKQKIQAQKLLENSEKQISALEKEGARLLDKKLYESDEVPLHLQSYNYIPPKPRKKSIVAREIEEKQKSIKSKAKIIEKSRDKSKTALYERQKKDAKNQILRLEKEAEILKIKVPDKPQLAESRLEKAQKIRDVFEQPTKFEFTLEDFPTKKDAQEYLEHLQNSITPKKPEQIKKSLQGEIIFMKNFIKKHFGA